jgi:hypothetical protein
MPLNGASASRICLTGVIAGAAVQCHELFRGSFLRRNVLQHRNAKQISVPVAGILARG